MYLIVLWFYEGYISLIKSNVQLKKWLKIFLFFSKIHLKISQLDWKYNLILQQKSVQTSRSICILPSAQNQ